jgi:chloride channel protein, CIC family
VLLPTFMLLGTMLGALGVVFNKTLVLALDWRARAFARVPFLYAVIVGAAVGVLAFVLPMAVGGGEALIPDLPLANLPLQTLLLIAVVRFVGTMASYPVGAPAGIFSPMLTLATTVGLAFGLLIEAALVHSPLAVPPLTGAAFAVAAMGGLFSSTIRAPLVGVVLVVELTGAFELILPLMVTCVTAHVVAQALGGRPVYEVLFERSERLAGRTAHARSAATSSPVGIDEPPRPDTR